MKESKFMQKLNQMAKEAMERKAIGDPTWKERHAQGIPVKMDWIRFAKCCADTQAVNGVVRGLQFGGYPIASSGAYGGVFCNFRYKQSWLDKKGGRRG
jgi:hypothetical protein